MPIETVSIALVCALVSGLACASVFHWVSGMRPKSALALGHLYYPVAILLFIGVTSLMKGVLSIPGPGMLAALAVAMPVGLLGSEFMKNWKTDV